MKLLQILSVVNAVAGFHFIGYVDEWHSKTLPEASSASALSHLVVAFAKSTFFNEPELNKTKPFTTSQELRSKYPSSKIMIAIGGWGDTNGLSDGAKDEASRKQYAKNVAAYVDHFGFDGVDIDWEYPGGNGDDYKKIPNEQKKGEIETYPLLLQAVREALPKDKVLSIAVPGRKPDMIAYTKEQSGKIWESVDHVNIMSYDLMNRRDAVTAHHSSVQGSLEVVKRYKELGLDGKKINLGFAFYAKFFETQPNCTEAKPLGCPVAVLEDPATGADTERSGAVTFEKEPFAKPEVLKSWETAKGAAKADDVAGGQYAYDPATHYFWTWDTPTFMERKFKDIVDAEGLGGVFVWSLGEDSAAWDHLKVLNDGAAKRRN
ncbi:putative class V chitinase [Aspergillus avenaceus]|uniref:chitinase n=1 Tax=Aspergillus avenaceus TaxID=36643 RepID=A0A5N6TP32_ASPAV|nr:putative class V chitinase [Aspergillus avenaceus]